MCASVCESWVPCLSQAHTPLIQCEKLKRKAISISAKVRLATCDEAISFIICFSSLRCHWEAFPCLIPWKCISLHSHPLFAAVAHRSWSSAASGTFTMWNSMRPFLWSSTHILSGGKKSLCFLEQGRRMQLAQVERVRRRPEDNTFERFAFSLLSSQQTWLACSPSTRS